MTKPEQQTHPAAPKKDKPPDIAAQIAPILNDWNIPPGDLSEISQATQRSLETVTKLTEYEDDKANRILTAMAFLSAFAAVIFAVVPSRYPLSMPLILIRRGFRYEAWLLIATYGAFILYALTLTVGVAFVLHAVRPRFNVPKGWKPKGSKPGSRLFFAKILDVSPADWANAFANAKKDEVLAEYAKNSILETYLIADKIAYKMKWLRRGVKLFFASTILLAVLLPLIVVTVALVPENPERPEQPSQQQQTQPASRDGVNLKQRFRRIGITSATQPPTQQPALGGIA